MKILITGATGFLGGRLVKKLLGEKSTYQVFATGRNELLLSELEKKGAITFKGDLSDHDFVNKITKEIEVIVHSSALSSPWGRFEDFYQANILSTKNIIEGAKLNSVKKIINISTPSIYFGYEDRFDIKEDFLPNKFVNFYAQTKYEAERLISQANSDALQILSLRPRAIIGGGDTSIMPRILKAQTEGKLKIIGSGNNIVDVSSVSNVCDAIILAINADKKAYGHSYNINNGSPVKLWELIEKTLTKLNYKLNKNKIPFEIAYSVAKLLETKAKFSKDFEEPVLTCYGVAILAKSMTMNIEKASNLLGYMPKQTTDETIDEFVDWWKLRNNK